VLRRVACYYHTSAIIIAISPYPNTESASSPLRKSNVLPFFHLDKLHRSPQLVLIRITQFLEQRRRRLRARRLPILHPVHAEVVLHDIGHGLRIGRRARPAAPDSVVHLGQLVGHAVGDVGAGGGAGVGAEDDASGEGYCHAAGGC